MFLFGCNTIEHMFKMEHVLPDTGKYLPAQSLSHTMYIVNKYLKNQKVVRWYSIYFLLIYCLFPLHR